MSYFPCDIPLMSDEELRENGIEIHKGEIVIYKDEETVDDDTISRQDVITLVENIENRRLMGEIDLTYAPMLKGVKALPPSPSIKPDAEQPESDKVQLWVV